MKNRAREVGQLWVCPQQQLSELTADLRVPRSSVGRSMALTRVWKSFPSFLKGKIRTRIGTRKDKQLHHHLNGILASSDSLILGDF